MTLRPAPPGERPERVGRDFQRISILSVFFQIATIGPICIPEDNGSSWSRPQSSATIVGWGSDGKKPSYDILQKTRIPIIPGDVCKAKFRRIRVNVIPQLQVGKKYFQAFNTTNSGNPVF